MNLIDIYKSVLKYTGNQADDDGYIWTIIGNEKQPVIIDGLRLVLPTSDQLRHFDSKDKIIFHPLAEDIIQGESVVIKKFKDIINVRLNYTIGVIAQSLLNLTASPELHKRLNPDQTELLLAIKDADEKSITDFIQYMLSGMKSKPDRVFTNIFLKKGGRKGNEKYARLGVVTFPFYDLLKDDTNTDIKIRKKDRATYRQLFEFIFINIDKKEEYNYGSNSRIAPYLDSLMNTSALIASRLNDLLELYGDFIEEAEALKFDSKWYEYFQNLEELLPLIKTVPAHGIQEAAKTSMESVSQIPTNTIISPQLMAPNQMQTSVQPDHRIVKTERGLDFDSVLQNTPRNSNAPNVFNDMLYRHHLMQQAPVDPYGRVQQQGYVSPYNQHMPRQHYTMPNQIGSYFGTPSAPSVNMPYNYDNIVRDIHGNPVLPY